MQKIETSSIYNFYVHILGHTLIKYNIKLCGNLPNTNTRIEDYLFQLCSASEETQSFLVTKLNSLNITL